MWDGQGEGIAVEYTTCCLMSVAGRFARVMSGSHSPGKANFSKVNGGHTLSRILFAKTLKPNVELALPLQQ